MKKSLLALAIFTLLAGCAKPPIIPQDEVKSEINQTEKAVEITPAPTPAEKVESAEPGTPVVLSDSDLKDMNIFFSNFSEAFFREYTEKTTDEEIVLFAMCHNRVNYYDRWSYEDSYEVIDATHISNTIDRFFDIKIQFKSTNNYEFKNNKFYVPAASGEQYLGFSQVESIMKNGDILVVRLIDFQYDNSDDLHGDFDKKAYEPMKNWSANLSKRCTRGDTATAAVKTANINGKNTYQLLSLRKD